MTTTINAEIARQYAPGMPMCEPTFAHDYGDYLTELCEPLSATFGTTFTLTQTGGWCMAINATLEGGDELLITDAYDTLSPMPIRRRCWRNDREILGYRVGYYPADNEYGHSGEHLCQVVFRR